MDFDDLSSYVPCDCLSIGWLFPCRFLVSFLCRKEVFERLHFSLDDAIGCPLGSIFEVKGSKLHRLEAEEDADELLMAPNDSGGFRFSPFHESSILHTAVFVLSC